MKKLFLIFFAGIVLVQCGLDECLQSTGDTILETIYFEPFDKVYIFKGISATIHQSVEHKIVITTGKNILPHINYELVDGTLSIRDQLVCNWVREFGVTHIDIYSPNLTEIHSRTEKNINSNGVLTYPSLGLYAIDLEVGAGLGDFHLSVNNDFIDIGTNNVAAFYLTGFTKHLNLGIYSGTGKVFAKDLQVEEHIQVFHRGSNESYVYPLGSISGNMYGIGNLILKHQPTSIDIKQHFTGRLVYDY